MKVTEPIVIRESTARRDGLFGGIFLVFALALARGFAGASSTTGRIVVAVVFGVLVVGALVAWIVRLRRAEWLEITDEHVELRDPKATETPQLVKTAGDRLQFVTVGGGRYRALALEARDGDAVLPLHFFAKKQVEAACTARGWRFD